MSDVPVDPTKPKPPLLVARHRPDPITLACIFMRGGAVVGVLNAVIVMATAGASAREFRLRAGETAATGEQIDEIANGLATWSMTAGLIGMVLALLVAVLAMQVWRGSQPARIAALVVVSASLLCGLGWSAFTVRGGTNLRPDGMDEETGRGISEALGMSTSGFATYVGGGLTCLQVLGYIAVLGLLAWPTSNPYFQRGQLARASGTGNARDDDTDVIEPVR